MASEEESNNLSAKTRKKFFKICECKTQFRTRSHYYNHKKKCAAINREAESDSGNFVCQEENCHFKAKLSELFMNHLKSVHNVENAAEDTKIFQNYAEFKIWMTEFQKETKSAFLHRQTRKTLKGRTEYFYCSRSGNYSTRSMGIRFPKPQGSKKIGFSCPATIRVSVQTVPEKVKATINAFHYGHDNQLCHLQIPKGDREEIAKQLSQGVQHSRVLRNLFNDHVTRTERKHLCTRRDLLNISRSVGIKKTEKHTDDHISVNAYVEESLGKEKHILLYKKRGDESLRYPNDETCPLDKNDFALGIMTNFQTNMLKEFGNNIVCLDVRHSTSSLDLNLITLMVVDEYKEGVPVAWFLSNKQTSVALTLFFRCIKKRITNISPKIFMSDKTPQYFNSWKDVFPGEIKKLLYHRRVREDWKRQLNKIKNKSTATTIYNKLCLLLEEDDKEKFENLLQKSCEQLIENLDLKEFGKYFIKEWAGNTEEWGNCYRIDYELNANMFVESFYMALKYGKEHLKYKQEKRVDKCLSILLQFAKDLEVKRSIKIEKRKTTEINNGHESATRLAEILVNKITTNTWEIIPEKLIHSDTSITEKLVYTVKRLSACRDNCKFKCEECDICLHSYICNCPTGRTATTICEHIHFIVLKEKEQSAEPGSFDTIIKEEHDIDDIDDNSLQNIKLEPLEDNQDENVFEGMSMSSLIVVNPQQNDTGTIKKQLLEKHMQIYEQIKTCTDRNSLVTASQHLTNAYNTLALSAHTSLPIESSTSKVPDNKNTEKQYGFLSTKNMKDIKHDHTYSLTSEI